MKTLMILSLALVTAPTQSFATDLAGSMEDFSESKAVEVFSFEQPAKEGAGEAWEATDARYVSDGKVKARNSSLEKRLRLRAGTYELVENDKSKPCRFNFGLKTGEKIQLNVKVNDKENEYSRRGDVDVTLTQYSPELERQVNVFDHPRFIAVNDPERENTTSDGLRVAHISAYSSDGEVLSHTVTMNAKGERENDVTQRVQFDRKGGFVYSQTHQEGRSFWDRKLHARCKFKKVD